MAKKQKGVRKFRAAAKPVKKAAAKKAVKAKRRAAPFDALLAPVKGATKRDIGHVKLEVGRAGAARVKRMIYPPGFHWAVDMKPNVGTELCMHAHVGFLARGEIHIEYADGCIVEHKAPQIVAIEPGHDGWVWGAGLGRVTVRFESAESGPGPVRTLRDDDPLLSRPERQSPDDDTDAV